MLLKTIDGGKTWQLKEMPLERFSAESIFWLSATEGWLAGYSCDSDPCFEINGKATLLKTTDGGVSWKKIYFDQNDPFFTNIYFLNSQTGWLAARDNLYKTLDGGTTWKMALRLPIRPV